MKIILKKKQITKTETGKKIEKKRQRENGDEGNESIKIYAE